MSDLIDRLVELEAASRLLDPGPADRAAHRDAIVAYSEAFLDSIPEKKAYEVDKSAAAEVWSRPISEEPAEVHELLELWAAAVDHPGLNPTSQGHMAYIPGGGVYEAALGDFLAAVTNRYSGVRYAGPGGVELENVVLDWMAGLVGYPPAAGGNLTSSGSLANLIAVVTARESSGLEAQDFERAVVYGTEQVHHCVTKALRIAGMGGCVRRAVAMDDGYRMRPEALDEAIARDRRAGLKPWMIVGNAGTTDVGSIDPLGLIADIAEANDLWYHVDAAYGGFFALCPEVRGEFDGMERSDSIVLDPHKGLFLPFGSGAILVKDKGAMLRAHSYEAAYMQDTVAEEALERSSPADVSPEFSRHFRGPRAWWPLQLHGIAPFRACLQEKLALARYFHREVQDLGFEVGPPPELSVATYRFVPPTGDANAFNRALLEEVHRDGRVFISSTMLEERFVLRLAVLSFRTHLDSVQLLLRILEEKVAELLEVWD